MIKISNTEVWGFSGALRGCRNPYMSHEKSDSICCANCPNTEKEGLCIDSVTGQICQGFILGEADMALAKKLIKAGPEHRKFLRMIHVQADVLAPRYFWQEASCYKWLNMNSSSTMHLITKRKLREDDFSFDDSFDATISGFDKKGTIINTLNDVIEAYNAEKDKELKECLFRQIKQMLPESYNQLRTIGTNYECLLNIYHQRKNHRLTEWSGENGFCSWIRTLPHMKEFLGVEND